MYLEVVRDDSLLGQGLTEQMTVNQKKKKSRERVFFAEETALMKARRQWGEGSGNLGQCCLVASGRGAYGREGIRLER